jgi:hypothetical protein
MAIGMAIGIGNERKKYAQRMTDKKRGMGTCQGVGSDKKNLLCTAQEKIWDVEWRAYISQKKKCKARKLE